MAITLLAGAVAVDRLFREHPWYASEAVALGLVVIAVGVCALGVRRWWTAERALRLGQPMPGFGVPLLGVLAVLLVAAGVCVLVVVPRAERCPAASGGASSRSNDSTCSGP